MSKPSFQKRALRLAAATGIAFVAIAPTAALAAPYPDGGGNDPSDPGSEVAANTARNASTLPFTGGDATGMALIGAGAVLAGAVIVRQTRRKAIA